MALANRSRTGRSPRNKVLVLMNLGEVELISKSVAGDEVSLQKLLVARADMLSRYVASKMPSTLRDQMDPEDIVQRTYVEVFRSIAMFRVDESDGFDGWLLGIAKNVIRDTMKRSQRLKRGGEFKRAPAVKSPSGALADLVDLLSGGGNTPSHSAMGHEAVTAVQDAITDLPDQYQQAVRLRLLEGNSLAETARVMNCSERAVQGFVDRAKKKMRAALTSLSKFR